MNVLKPMPNYLLHTTHVALIQQKTMSEGTSKTCRCTALQCVYIVCVSCGRTDLPTVHGMPSSPMHPLRVPPCAAQQPSRGGGGLWLAVHPDAVQACVLRVPLVALHLCAHARNNQRPEINGS